MNKILIFSEDALARYDIQQILHKYMDCQVAFAENLKSIIFQVENRPFNLIIYDTDTFKLKDFKHLKNINKEYNKILSLVTHNQSKVSESFLETEKRIHCISKPYLERGLIGLVKKLINKKQTPKQKYRRYMTNQSAKLEALDSGFSCDLQMFNLSKGGVYFEYDGNEPMAIGEIVRVKVNLNEMLREHVMNAKIVWTTPKGTFTGKKGIGCQFVSRDEMYQHLLSRI